MPVIMPDPVPLPSPGKRSAQILFDLDELGGPTDGLSHNSDLAPFA
jgi:hypothetical protein